MLGSPRTKPAIRQHCPSGRAAAHTLDRASGMNRRAGHIQAAQRGAMPAQLGAGRRTSCWSGSGRGPRPQIAVDEASGSPPRSAGGCDRPRHHRISAKPGEPFELSLDQAGDVLLRAGVACGNVGVAVQGVLTCRRARGVKPRVAARRPRRGARHVPAGRPPQPQRLAQFAADVDHGGSACRLGRPRHRPPQRVVELERRGRVPPFRSRRSSRSGSASAGSSSSSGRALTVVTTHARSAPRRHAGHPGGTPSSDDDRSTCADRTITPSRGRRLSPASASVIRCWPPAGNGQPCKWAEQRQQEPEHTAPRRRRRKPGVLRGPRQPCRRPGRPSKTSKPKRFDRFQHPPREKAASPRSATANANDRADRRQGAEDGIHETLSQRPELLDQPPPGSSRSGTRHLQRGDRRLELMMRRQRGFVLERVRHDHVGPDHRSPSA